MRPTLTFLAAGAVMGALFVLSDVVTTEPRPAAIALTALADEPPSAVEDFSYPGRDRILADRGFRLITGNGRIQLADCVPGGAGQIVLSSSAFTDAICFRATGAAGYLSMQIPEVFSIKGDDHPATATISIDGAQPQTTEIKKNVWNPINKADGATLLELRTSS